MSEMILTAGTKVKFGTVSTALYPILRHGIAGDTVRQGFQLGDDARVESTGIYVGELMAYYAACAAFCNATSALHAANQDVLSIFVKQLQNAHGEKPKMPELEDIAAQAGLPIVLEITLEEDCLLQADDHFVDDETGDKSW
jgi:hypothetical protein